ncbi:ribbon-helix-helix domain-containing protein [Pseudohoeflea coraliihabitans]|uniref:Antitoxin-like ribbon-helix-helix domain-containing protein n=1 Tax=Pseudohoeflea coraliihabitans TaxID=2860393 RepID=A0ABS6WVZ6_9HYPH|nr:ribbon-helix-helix domain-containing protein [Pseudohoeflea sp. DP4N28-3]MBW3099270.1 hypothetical protein [Pseudohoeflea sp. DP4N28-3]
MAKKANLASALDDVTPAPVAQVEHRPARERSTPVIPSREGTVLVGAHLPARYGKALKLLAAETGETQRQLIEEALDLLFVKKGAKV